MLKKSFNIFVLAVFCLSQTPAALAASNNPSYQRFAVRFPEMVQMGNTMADQFDAYVNAFLKEDGVADTEIVLKSGNEKLILTWQHLAHRDPTIFNTVVNGGRYKLTHNLVVLASLLMIVKMVTFAVALPPGMDRSMVFLGVAFFAPFIMGKGVRQLRQKHAEYLTALEGNYQEALKKSVFFGALALRGYNISPEFQQGFFNNMHAALAAAGCAKLISAPKVRVAKLPPPVEVTSAQAEAEEYAAQAVEQEPTRKMSRGK